MSDPNLSTVYFFPPTAVVYLVAWSKNARWNKDII